MLDVKVDVPVRRRTELEVDRGILNDVRLMDGAVVERLLHSAGRDARRPAAAVGRTPTGAWQRYEAVFEHVVGVVLIVRERRRSGAVPAAPAVGAEDKLT